MSKTILPQGWADLTPQQRGAFVTDVIESTDALHTDDFIIALLQHDVDVSVPGFCGYAMLINAARCRNPAVLEAILKKPGADINIANSEGTTAFMLATSLGKFDNMKFLTLKDANVNAQNTVGETALNMFMHVIYRNDLPAGVMKAGTDALLRHLLFDAKCDPNIADGHGLAPLDTCALLKDSLKVKWMLEAGAEPTQRALDMAGLAGDEETITLIKVAHEASLPVLRAKALQAATSGTTTTIDEPTVTINTARKTRITLGM